MGSVSGWMTSSPDFANWPTHRTSPVSRFTSPTRRQQIWFTRCPDSCARTRISRRYDLTFRFLLIPIVTWSATAITTDTTQLRKEWEEVRARYPQVASAFQQTIYVLGDALKAYRTAGLLEYAPSVQDILCDTYRLYPASVDGALVLVGVSPAKCSLPCIESCRYFCPTVMDCMDWAEHQGLAGGEPDPFAVMDGFQSCARGVSACRTNARTSADNDEPAASTVTISESTLGLLGVA